jgi:Ni/Fe-hydrogenase subunit HybB-like protein
MTAVTRKIQLTPFIIWLGILILFMGLGAIAGVLILTKGLYLTNLTDLIPWGLWITIDLSAIALSAGAFLLCAAVYILGLKRYLPVARTATFIGLVGYSMALLCLLLDIGRPDRFWHALVFWNPHSVLWEVTMCVALYFTVLTLETAPIFANFSWFKRRYPILSLRMVNLHHYAPYLAIIGLGLSMLHQSSLGATYGVLKARPIWYRPDLSVLFMVSAMAGGPALTVLVSMLAARFYRRVKIDEHILERVTYFIGWVLVGYLYFRFWDAMSMNYTYHPGRTEGLQLLTKGPLAFNFWALEIILGIVIPVVLLQVKRYRQQPLLRMVALALVVSGVIAYRWDVNIAGQLVLLTYLPQEIATRYTTYIPSIIETLAGLGILAYGLMALTLGVRYLNIVDHTSNLVEEVEPQAIAVVGD